MDWQPAGGPGLPSGGAEADDGESDQRLRCPRDRGQRVPRWVPHTTPSSLPDRRARLAGADHQLASLDGQSERVGRGTGPVADRGGEQRRLDDDVDDVVDQPRGDAARLGGDKSLAGSARMFMMITGRVRSCDSSRHPSRVTAKSAKAAVDDVCLMPSL